MIPDTQERADMLLNIENGKHVFIDWKLNLQVLMKRQFVTNSRCDLALGILYLCNNFLFLQNKQKIIIY